MDRRRRQGSWRARCGGAPACEGAGRCPQGGEARLGKHQGERRPGIKEDYKFSVNYKNLNTKSACRNKQKPIEDNKASKTTLAHKPLKIPQTPIKKH